MERSFSPSDIATPFIFKFEFIRFVGLYIQAETTSVTKKNKTKILGGGGFPSSKKQNRGNHVLKKCKKILNYNMIIVYV